MKHLKSFNKLFEEATPKPIKKFPTEPAIHWNYLMKILEESGINPHKSLVKGKNMTYFQDFCFEKCSKENIVFPNRKDNEDFKNDHRYKNFIFGESIFLLPEHYDSSGDAEQSMKPTENITNILNILEHEFGDEISGTNYEGFPVYIDYYKEIKIRY